MRRKQSTKEELKGYRRHYSERAFWRKLGAMPRTAGLALVERSILLYAIATDKSVSLWARTLIVAALGYFIWVLDAVPDTVPVLGYADDVAVMGLVLSQVGRFVTPAVRARARRLLPEGLRTETKKRRTKSNEQAKHKEG